MPTPLDVDLGAGLALALRDLSTVPAVHALTLQNLDRLRRWEAWAHGEQTEADLASFTQAQLEAWRRGGCLPAVVVRDGNIVGTASARIDGYTQTADIGYWIDRNHEGQGLVSRSVTALIDLLVTELGIMRVEIRTGTENVRSRALAERLGFVHEGTLREAIAVAGSRHDAAIYGLLAHEWRPSR